MGVIFGLIAIVVLLGISSFLAAAEVAYFSLEPAEMEMLNSDKDQSAARVLTLIEKPKKLLATLLIWINFLNIGVVVISTYISEELLNFSDNPLINFLIQVIAVTFLILLVAEVIPKIYSTQQPVRVAKFMAGPVNVLQTIASPLSSLLMASTSIIDKKVKKRGHNISVDQLSHALELTTTEGNEQEQKILEGIVKFGNTEVSEIMRSRLDISAFEYDTPFDLLLKNIIEAGFSRIPVYKETLDQVEGVLFVKDLLKHLDKPADFKWQELLSPAFFVPGTKKLDDLLKEFQHKKIHLAIVVDEYGGTMGLVTLEDILEEIVGDISDEFDDEDVIYSKLDDNNYVFEGKILLNDMFRILDIDGNAFDDHRGDSDTLAGFILEISGRMPRKNEKLDFENYRFTIESADGRRIKRVKLTIVSRPEEEE